MAGVEETCRAIPDAAVAALFLLRAGGRLDEAQAKIVRAFGPGQPVSELLIKAGVGAGGGAGTWGAELADDNMAATVFRERVDEIGAFGRLTAGVTVPVNVPIVLSGEGVEGGWVGEHQRIRVSPLNLTRTVLQERTVGAIVVMTSELVESRRALKLIRRALVRVGSRMVDAALLDPSNAGIADVKPPAITFGAPSVAATSSPTADMKSLFDAFEGNADTMQFVAHPKTAARLALAREAGAVVFHDAGVRGGTMLGAPLLAAAGCPEGILVAVDPFGLLIVDEGFDLKATDEAMVEMDDAPDGTGAAVSLFQEHGSALRILRYCNWQVGIPGSVAVLTGINY